MSPIQLYMAPMKGFTDHLFRTAFTEHFGGFDLAVSPFITTKKGFRVKRNTVKDVFPENNTRLPVVPQILGNTPGDFVVLANTLYDLGYRTVNWNLGCPYPMVANKQRGSGLLPHTERIQAILDQVVPELHGSLSLKVRLGWKDSSDIFRLLPAMDAYPLSEIIIHPRTGIQRYGGSVDLDAFETCLAMTRHPVVYNGDIRTVGDFRRLSRRFDRVHAWMIGRGCLVDPFLPGRIKNGADDALNKIHHMKRFHQDLFQAYSGALSGPSHVLNKMKGLWRYFSLPFEDCKKSLKEIKKARRPDTYLERVNRFFDTEAVLLQAAEP